MSAGLSDSVQSSASMVFDGDNTDPLDALAKWGGRVGALSRLRPQYHVEWPLGLVISSQAVARLARTHRFLLYHRDAEAVLSASWVEGRHRGRVTDGAPQDPTSAQRVRWQHMFRSELQHFVTTFDAYLHCHVVDGCWKWLESRFSRCKNLRELRQLYDRFAVRAADRCFVGIAVGADDAQSHAEKLQRQVLRCILLCYRSIFRFGTALVINRTQAAQNGGALPEDAFAQLTGHRDYFRKQLRFLIAGLRVASNTAGGMEHMQDLLVRLNFNNYYEQRK